MIGTFKDNKLKKLWEQKSSNHFDTTLHKPILLCLDLIQEARIIDDLNEKDVHKLNQGSGRIPNLGGKFSIKVNGMSRICFSWDSTNGIANDIEFIKNYH